MYHFLHIRKGKVTQDQYIQSTPETVIMIRGMSRSYRSWLGLEKELSEQFDVICVDLPGVGLSKDEELLYTVQEMAFKILDLICTLRFRQMYFVAPSLGAMVVLELAKHLPIETVRGLILMAPSHSGVGFKRLTRQTVSTFKKSLKASQSELLELMSELVIGKTSDGRSIREVDLPRLQAWEQALLADTEDLGFNGRYSHMIAALAYTSRKALNHVRRYQIPLKVLIPTDDRMIPVAHEQAVYEYLKHPQSAVIELQNAGHDIVVTHAKQVQDIIVQFVKEHTTYRVYPVQMLEPKANRRQLQNRFYTSLGLLSLGMFLFSWLFKGPKKPDN